MLSDRVRETSTTTGNGNMTLNGASPGYNSFNTGFGVGVEFYYVIEGSAGGVFEWEVGIGHLSASTILVRDVVLANSDGNTSAHNFGVGLKQIYNDSPAGFLEQPIFSDTDGATITFDMSRGRIHTVTLGGNRTLALSNVVVGSRFIIILVQDGTGSRTVTWFTTIKWPGGTAPTLTTGAGKTDVFGFICTSAGNYLGYTIGQNQ